GFPLRGDRPPDCRTLLAVSLYRGVDGPLIYLPSFTQMTGVSLGVGIEGQLPVLVRGLVGEPLPLFCHGGGIRLQKTESIKSNVNSKIAASLSRQRVVDSPLGVIEALQSQ